MLSLTIGAITINWINLMAYGPVFLIGMLIYLLIFWAAPWWGTFNEGQRLMNVWRMHLYTTIVIFVIASSGWYINWSVEVIHAPNNNGKIIEKVIER